MKLHKFGTVAAASLLCLLASGGPASALDRGNAADYADTWYDAKNGVYPGFSDDCTNFISQALHAGGIKFRTADFSWSGPYDNPAYWYANGTLDEWTQTWAVAKKSANWVNGLANGRETVVPANQEGAQPPSGYRKRGNVVYYDWDGDGVINHASIVTVADGTDPSSGRTGTLIDQHTTNRKHAIWNLVPYNSQAQTTVYYVVYVDDAAS